VTSGSESVGTNSFDISLSAGQNISTVDFGYAEQSASIGDTVWLDVNENGIQDANESVLPNIQVTLLDPGADGLFGNTDDITRTTTTDTNGNYVFTGLDAGDYRVSVVVPTGMSLTTPSALNTQSLATGQNLDTVDFGLSGVGLIGDTVWFDMDGDGVQDANEPGLANVSLSLISAGTDGVLGTADDVIIQTQATDANGNYQFNNLGAAHYRVSVDDSTLPSDFSLTQGTDPQDVLLLPNQH